MTEAHRKAVLGGGERVAALELWWQHLVGFRGRYCGVLEVAGRGRGGRGGGLYRSGVRWRSEWSSSRIRPEDGDDG